MAWSNDGPEIRPSRKCTCEMALNLAQQSATDSLVRGPICLREGRALIWVRAWTGDRLLT